MEAHSNEDDDIQKLLNELKSHLKRPIRILHVGNIANNAYLNAKLLNEIGADCDVLCHSYFHIMGCPEWEELDRDFSQLDQKSPEWYQIDLGDYERPRWFAQGSFETATEYLCAKRSGNTESANLLWRKLGIENKTRRANHARLKIANVKRVLLAVSARTTSLHISLRTYLRRYPSIALLISRISTAVPFWSNKLEAFLVWFTLGNRNSLVEYSSLDYSRLETLIREFSVKFPDRADQLIMSDLVPYAGNVTQFRKLIAHYDVVQAYATEVALPMIAGGGPYCAFEHGTLRTFTLGETPLCRVTALGYRLADHVLITNGDCRSYAEILGITSYSAMIHPIDERRYTSHRSEPQSRTHARLLCTLRHDWEVKGTDIYIRALPQIRESVSENIKVIMVTWGADLSRSFKLANMLGVEDMITWVSPMSHARLVTLLTDTDVVLDQLALPHFGATAPEAIAAGVPVISSYVESSTEWILSSPAPIIPAFDIDGICRAVETALDPKFRSNYRTRAWNWITAEHSHRRAQLTQLRAYRDILKDRA